MKKTLLPKRISVIGLGKLGACLAAFYADRGMNVLGTDVDTKKVGLINKGKAPVLEPELGQMIRKNRAHLRATNDLEETILKTDVSFIIVPTPSNKDGSFSVDFVKDFARKAGAALRKKKKYHLFVLVSTVLPEDSRKKILPVFEKYSGKKAGRDFGYCYSPTLIALGSVIENLRNADFLFVGELDKKSGDILESIYKKIYSSTEKVRRMSIESGELAKISLNAYVTMKITFANILGELCGKIPNADVDSITNSIGRDRRIGSCFFKSGLGYGGPCFPRDNFALANTARKRGIPTPLALITHRLNKEIPGKIAKLIKSELKAKKRVVGILSLAYKPNTPIAEESQAVEISELLLKKGVPVVVYDEFGYEETRPVLQDSVFYANNLREALKKSSVIFIANKNKEFEKLPQMLRKTKGRKVIVDPWGMFNSKVFSRNVKYVPLGRKPQP